MKWEYKIANGEFEETYETKAEVVTAEIVAWMNGLGSEGWEIIDRNAIHLGVRLHINVLCKREYGKWAS